MEVGLMSWHQFTDPEGNAFGSAEVFFTCGSADQESPEAFAPGWYFCSCFPGCLPDSDPIGPFETEEEAVSYLRGDG